VWRNFKHVILNDTPVDFVMCLTCSHVVTFKKKDGTKGMHAHKCGTEEPAPVQRKMTSFVERHNLPQPACDMRPYSSVDGTGFKSLCQTLVNFGAQYGQFDVARALTGTSHECQSTIGFSMNKVTIVTDNGRSISRQMLSAIMLCILSEPCGDRYVGSRQC